MALTVLIWGFNWIVMKYLAQYIGAWDLVVMRNVLACPILFGMLLATRKSIRLPPFWLTVGIGLFQSAAFQCLTQLALITGGAGHVAMLAYTMPFWVVLFAWLFFGDHPTRRHAIGFVLAGAGLLAVIGRWSDLGSLTSSLLAVGGGFSWGLGTVFSQMMFQRHSPGVLNLTAWQMLLGAVFTLPFIFIFPQPVIDWQPGVVWGLAYMAVMASAMAWALWLWVVRRVRATVAAMSSLGIPVLTVALSWIIFSERPGPLGMVGVVLMMAGLVVVNWPAPESDPAANAA
jgi:drug/metabolite transporter (DMT)-like permease